MNSIIASISSCNPACWQLWTSVAANIAMVVGVLAVILLWLQYRQIKRAEFIRNTIDLINLLQQQHIREARYVVQSQLKDLPLSKYDNRQSEAAGTVCASYDVAGMLVKRKYVEKNLILDNWGPSIMKNFIILKQYIYHRRNENGPLFWNDFEYLYDTCRRWHSKHGALIPAGRFGK